jgi:hypothetical protein
MSATEQISASEAKKNAEILVSWFLYDKPKINFPLRARGWDSPTDPGFQEYLLAIDLIWDKVATDLVSELNSDIKQFIILYKYLNYERSSISKKAWKEKGNSYLLQLN